MSRVLFIKSDVMGIDPPELGTKMIGSFLRKLCRQPNKPSTILFYGTGVKLLAEGSPVLDAVGILHDAGVDIVACGTCVGFFELRSNMALGRISDMVEIVSIVMKSDHVITM